MSTKENGGPAFPAQHFDLAENEHGLTMRDWFAAKAMAGMLADLPKTLYGLDWQQKTAASSYEMADAMLKARAA